MTTTTLEGMIVSQEGVRGGRPIIRDTGVTVRGVVGYYKQGLTPEEIADQLSIDFAGVYAAIAYYHLNCQEIEQDIAANSEAAVMREFSSE